MTVAITYGFQVVQDCAVVPSPVGNWWLEWSEKGLLNSAATEARPFGQLPTWLAESWEQFWLGEDFSISLATGIHFSPLARRLFEGISTLVPSWGQRISLTELSKTLGLAQAQARQLSSILKRNPWAPFVPTHRVTELKDTLWDKLRNYELPAWTTQVGLLTQDLSRKWGHVIQKVFDKK